MRQQPLLSLLLWSILGVLAPACDAEREPVAHAVAQPAPNPDTDADDDDDIGAASPAPDDGPLPDGFVACVDAAFNTVYATIRCVYPEGADGGDGGAGGDGGTASATDVTFTSGSPSACSGRCTFVRALAEDATECPAG